MPIAVVLTLTPPRNASPPQFLGRAAHAWFLNEVRKVDPTRNRRLHAPDARKPFTVSPLFVDPPGAQTPLTTWPLCLPGKHIRAGQPCYVRITAVAEEIVVFLKDKLLPRWRNSQLDLGGIPFSVQSIAAVVDAHPRAAITTYAALSEGVAHKSPPTAVTLHFLSPTVFRRSPPRDSAFTSKSHNLPFPQPDLVFGNLLSTWQAFAPQALPDDLPAYVRECVVISRYHLHTKKVTFGSGRRGTMGGFVGTCRFAIVGSHPTMQRAVGLLSAFAPFAGVGLRTTMGLGQVANGSHT